MPATRDLDRIDETRDGLADLRGRVDTWFELRRSRDALRQHWTQLGALERVLESNLERVQGEVDAVATLKRTGEIRAECRRNDQRVHLLDRYWRYFSEKWDQRDDDAIGCTLLAADEVVWSCWATPFVSADEPVAAAPLPYIEPFFTPRAIPRTMPPADVLRADPLLRSALTPLPVPLIGLPSVVHSRPWWLATIAHETGHHIQRDLSGGVFHARLGAAMEAVAVKAGVDEGIWREWHEETFADACSVLLLGPAAAVATTEALRGGDAGMLAESKSYPPGAVRLQLMAEVLAAAGCPLPSGVPEYRPDGIQDYELDPADEPLREQATARARAVGAIASELLRQAVEGGGSLPKLCGWTATRYGSDGEVAYWRDELLRADGDPLPATDPHSARTALGGGVAAWQVIAAEDDAAARADARCRLATRLRKLLPLCRPVGRRAGPDLRPLDVEPAGTALTAVLFGEEIEAEI